MIVGASAQPTSACAVSSGSAAADGASDAARAGTTVASLLGIVTDSARLRFGLEEVGMTVELGISSDDEARACATTLDMLRSSFA